MTSNILAKLHRGCEIPRVKRQSNMTFWSCRVESAPEERLNPGHSAWGSNPRSCAPSHPTTTKKYKIPTRKKLCLISSASERRVEDTENKHGVGSSALHSNQQQILFSSAGFLHSGGFAPGLHHQARHLPPACFENLQERRRSARLSGRR